MQQIRVLVAWPDRSVGPATDARNYRPGVPGDPAAARGSLGPGLAGAPGSPGLLHELAVLSFGQVVSASSIVGKMVNTGLGPVARKAANRERT